jgi:nitrous oxide reductase accessory protein NosL
MKTVVTAICALAMCLGLVAGACAHEDRDHGAMGDMMGAHHTAQGVVEEPAKCQVCGMDRTVFSASRVLVTFADGKTVGTCSINCAHEAAAHAPGKITAIRVADYVSKKLIDAKKAAWVIGGSKPGVMSATAKWAFADKAAAKRFVTENGGKVATFAEAWKAAGL